MRKGSLKWVVWLCALVLSFAIMEGLSLHDNTSTLSHFVWVLTADFPPILYIAGFLAGFLCCHFWWMGSPNVDQGQVPIQAAGKGKQQ